jgi:hypothetical protein
MFVVFEQYKFPLLGNTTSESKKLAAFRQYRLYATVGMYLWKEVSFEEVTGRELLLSPSSQNISILK